MKFFKAERKLFDGRVKILQAKLKFLGRVKILQVDLKCVLLKKVCGGSAVSHGSCLITPTLLVHSHFHNLATWDGDEGGDGGGEEEEAIEGDQLTMGQGSLLFPKI